MKYTEVKFALKNNDVVIETTQNRIIVNGNTHVIEKNFQQEKENIKASLLEQPKETSDNSVRGSKHRRRA